MRYSALQLVMIPAGALVKLAPEQAARTRSLVDPVDSPKGWARVRVPFQFKPGEKFDTDFDFGKGFAGVESDADAKARAAAEAEAKAKAKAEADAKAKAEAEAAKAKP